MKKNIEKKTWNDFRATGLFVLVNMFLHAFGWVLVVSVDDEDGEVKECFPARTKYRGFTEKDQEQAYNRIGKYIANNGKEIYEDGK